MKIFEITRNQLLHKLYLIQKARCYEFAIAFNKDKPRDEQISWKWFEWRDSASDALHRWQEDNHISTVPFGDNNEKAKIQYRILRRKWISMIKAKKSFEDCGGFYEWWVL